MIWRFDPMLTCYDLSCSPNGIRDLLRLRRPLRAVLAVPDFLVRLFVVCLANTLLYPCGILDQVAFNGLSDAEWDALDAERGVLSSEPENGDDGRPEKAAENADSSRTGLVTPSGIPSTRKNGGIRHV